jgi:tyrosinase
MQALPNTDPLSWAYQANIHATWFNPPPPEPAPTSELPGWTTCEHGSLYFWPWHRMYLYWFERIIREMSGDATFALPYWDYSDPNQRVLPAPFRDPASPLFVAERDADVNNGIAPTGLDFIFDHCSGLAETVFDFASFSLEGTPHGAVHVWVAGPGGWMGAFDTAARDPIFWLHHSNIDRLWESWVALGNANSTDPTWLANDVTSFSGRPYDFFDEAGAQVATIRVVSEVLDLSALGYEYEALADLSGCPAFLTAPPGGEEAPAGTPAATPEGPVEFGSSPPDEEIAVGPAPTTVPVTLEQPEAAAATASAGGATVLTLEGVQGTGVPAVAVEVYINLPPGQEPDIRSPYYVGNLNLFGLLFPDAEHQDMAMPSMTQQFNIARNVAALEERGEWTGALEVTLVPHYTASTAPPEAAGATPEAAEPPPGPWVTVESVSLTTR